MAPPDAPEPSQAEATADADQESDIPKSKTGTSHPSAINRPHAPHVLQLPRPSFSSSTSTLSGSVPLPPAESGAYPKEPGNTRSSLERIMGHLHVGEKPTDIVMSPIDMPYTPINAKPTPTATPVSSPKPASKAQPAKAATSPAASTVVRPSRSRAPSVGSETHKFNLKDLLSSGPKLARRASGSRRSESSDGGGGADTKSEASFKNKYGVCGKVAVGKGATSVVRLAHKWDRSEEKLYAVKEFRKKRKNETDKDYIKKLTAEFCISSTLHHINCVETVDLIQDEQLRWCEVMEFCPGGDLYAAIKRGGMSASEVECCFRQMCEGVGYLHQQGVAHRDIKPENLFFDTQGHLKIGDYGASTVYRLPWEATVHMSTGLCGSEPYIAPEQFLGKAYDARLVDIWACGIVYYCLHFQELPWRVAQTSDTLYAAYASAAALTSKSQPHTPTAMTPSTPVATQTPSSSNPPINYPPTITNLSPRACRPLLRAMLEPIPSKRFLIEDVLANAWMQSIDICYRADQPRHVHVHARAVAGELAPA